MNWLIIISVVLNVVLLYLYFLWPLPQLSSLSPERTALLVASLAALASLFVAIYSIITAWLESRGLRVEVLASAMGPGLIYSFSFTLTNPTRSPNWVSWFGCAADSGPCGYTAYPSTLRASVIAPFSEQKGEIKVDTKDLSERRRRLTLTFTSVRGRPRRVSFRRKDLERGEAQVRRAGW